MTSDAVAFLMLSGMLLLSGAGFYGMLVSLGLLLRRRDWLMVGAFAGALMLVGGLAMVIPPYLSPFWRGFMAFMTLFYLLVPYFTLKLVRGIQQRARL
mgnify:CR=1 FL=1